MRVCLVCKIPLKNHSLCEHCLRGLLKLREPVVRDEKLYRIHSLFSWRELSPPALAWMVKSLKNQEWPDRWFELVIEMAWQFGPLNEAVFVPVPSTKRNHALGLARALSRMTGFPVEEALGPGDDHEQKLRTRVERQEVHFERRLWNFCREYTNVIVVDDVVTTGATIRAAFHALGRPRKFQGWCLLDRRPTLRA